MTSKQEWEILADGVYIRQAEEDNFDVLHAFRSAYGSDAPLELHMNTVDFEKYTDDELNHEIKEAYGSLDAFKKAQPDQWRQRVAEVVAENKAFSGTSIPLIFPSKQALDEQLKDRYGIVTDKTK